MDLSSAARLEEAALLVDSGGVAGGQIAGGQIAGGGTVGGWVEGGGVAGGEIAGAVASGGHHTAMGGDDAYPKARAAVSRKRLLFLTVSTLPRASCYFPRCPFHVSLLHSTLHFPRFTCYLLLTHLLAASTHCLCPRMTRSTPGVLSHYLLLQCLLHTRMALTE